MSQVFQSMIRCARLFRIRTEKRVGFDNNGSRSFLVELSRQWLLVLGMIASSVTANASTLIGEWTGTGQIVPADGSSEAIDLYFLTQTPNGSAFELTGTIKVTCTNSPDPKCGSGGIVSFTGSLAADESLTFTATGAAVGSFNEFVHQKGLSGVVTDSGN